MFIFSFHIVVQEYERAVIFRMGRLRSGGARGEYLFLLLFTFPHLCERVWLKIGCANEVF